MKTGGIVSVWPIGQPREFVLGRVALMSENGVSLALAFEEKPEFLRYVNVATKSVTIEGLGDLARAGELVMLLIRTDGFWLDLVDERLYEVSDNLVSPMWAEREN